MCRGADPCIGPDGQFLFLLCLAFTRWAIGSMVGNSKKRPSDKSPGRLFRNIRGEAKVKLAVDMTSTVYKVTMDSVRDRHPGISQKKLFQLTRRRLQRRPPIWMEDAVPFFAETERCKLRDLAGRWKMTNQDTEEVLKGPKRFWSQWTP